MPSFTIPIANTYDAISRPIYTHIAKEVMNLCRIEQGDAELFLPGERGVVSQPGTAETLNDKIRYTSKSRVYCEVNDTVRHDQLYTTKVRTTDQVPVLYDESLKVSISPVYVQHDLELRFTYLADSKHKALQWRENMATRIAEVRHANYHVIKYSLTLNEDILILLSQIHLLKENVAGYNETFTEYFKRLQVREVIARTTIDGDPSKAAFQIDEQQGHISGYFDNGELSEGERKDDNILYETEFTYKLSYLKPTHWHIQYPIMIHQQHMPLDFVDTKPNYTLDDYDQGLADPSWRAFERIRWRCSGPSNAVRGGLRYPYYDDFWKPQNDVAWSVPIVTWMIGLEENNPQLVLDLRDLPDMDFTPNMLAYMKDHHELITKPKKALCFFTLYENEHPISEELLTIDHNLIVRTTKPLNMRSVYHLRFSIHTSHEYLPKEVIHEVCRYPIAALEMAQTVLPNLDVEWAIETKIDHDIGELEVSYFIWVMEDMMRKGLGQGNGNVFYPKAKAMQAAYVSNMTLDTVRNHIAPAFDVQPFNVMDQVVLDVGGYTEDGEFAFEDGIFDELVVIPEAKPKTLEGKLTKANEKTERSVYTTNFPLYNNFDKTVSFLSVFARKR